MTTQPQPPRSARYLFCIVLLILEAFIGLFMSLVLYGLRIVPPLTAWLIGGGIALAALIAAGLLRSRAGLIAGTLVQILLIAAGFWVPDMFLLGIIFAVLWGFSVVLGGRIDVEREQRYQAELAHWKQQ